MDLSFIEHLIPNVAAWLHVEPATVLLIVVTVSSISNIIARAIPDDTEGFLGGVRNVCKVLGMYVSNRVQSGVSVNEVVGDVADSQRNSTIADRYLNEWPEGSGTLREPVVPAFPGFKKQNEELNDEPTEDSAGYRPDHTQP